LLPFQTLSRFTLLLDFTVVDPSQSLAFPMNVMALLPYMVQNYEDANELCIISAENIAQVGNASRYFGYHSPRTLPTSSLVRFKDKNKLFHSGKTL
jgi:hypothetical protein